MNSIEDHFVLKGELKEDGQQKTDHVAFVRLCLLEEIVCSGERAGTRSTQRPKFGQMFDDPGSKDGFTSFKSIHRLKPTKCCQDRKPTCTGYAAQVQSLVTRRRSIGPKFVGRVV